MRIICLTWSSERRCYVRGPLQYFVRKNKVLRIFYMGNQRAIKVSGNTQHAFPRKKKKQQQNPSLITLSVIYMHPGTLGTLLHRLIRPLQP